MKIYIIYLCLLFSITLNGQNIGFKYQSTSSDNVFGFHVIELTGKKYLCVVNDYASATQSVPKLIILSESGNVLDSVRFERPNKHLTILKMIQTSYGFCLLGIMRENNISSFWFAKLDKQYHLTEEKFESTQQMYLTSILHTIDRDSNIVLLMLTESNSNSITAKIDKLGKLKSFKFTDKFNLYPNSIMAGMDSSRYFITDVGYWTVTDTAFNIIYKEVMKFTDTVTNTPTVGLYTNAIRKNDSTFYLAAKCFWTRPNNRKDLLFSTLDRKGKAKYLNVILGKGDSSYQSPIVTGVDTSKDGRFIFYGATYNFDKDNFYHSSFRSCFKLVKMDTNYNIIWEKRYGDDAYYVLNGLLTTSDGGCIMYGTKYNYNTFPKTDAIIIKVDGNGLVTSETAIPIIKASITAYPNPSTGQMNFKKETPSVFDRFDVSIFDMSGKLVYQKKETDLSETIDLTHLAEGNYMYQIQQQGVIKAVGKWVKMK